MATFAVAASLTTSTASAGAGCSHQGYNVFSQHAARQYGPANVLWDSSAIPTQAALAAPPAGAIVKWVTTRSGNGAWGVTSDGAVYTLGDAPYHGGITNIQLNAPIVDIAPTWDDGGYWILGRDSGVFAKGDAEFWDSAGQPGDGPAIAITAGPHVVGAC